MRLTVQGRNIEARWWGPRVSDRAPVVLLHEGLGSVAMWRDFPERLALRTERRVIAYSRLGHGSSDPPRVPHTTRFMHEEALTWLPGVLDAAEIDRAVLLGHSDGGSIAVIFAAEHGQRAESLILEAPHVFVEDISIASIARMKTTYVDAGFRRRLARYHDNVDLAFRGWNDIWLDPAFRSWNIEAYLPRVTCPALVIQGTDDEYETLTQVEAIQRQVGGSVATLVLERCGHSPHRDQPDVVLEGVARFLKKGTVPFST